MYYYALSNFLFEIEYRADSKNGHLVNFDSIFSLSKWIYILSLSFLPFKLR